MGVKETLNAYREVSELVKDLIGRKEMIDQRIKSVKSAGATELPRGGPHRTIEDMIIEKDDLEQRINNLNPYAIQKKRMVQKYIDTVYSIKHNRILTFYYINCMDVKEIAEAESYSVRNTYKLLDKAIKMVKIDE